MLRSTTFLALILLAGASLLAAPPGGDDQADEFESGEVARNWVAYQVASGIFNEDRQIVSSETVIVRGVAVATAYQLEPEGFVLVPMDQRLPPVKAFSESHRFSSEPGSMGRLVADELHSIVTGLRKVDAESEGPAKASAYFSPENSRMWDWLTKDEATFRSGLPGAKAQVDMVPPLMSAAWGQSWPFNMYCPTACGEPTYVGCVATATSQIIHYWKHPASGTGDHTYAWDGDGCGAMMLSADFSDPYDWDNMVDRIDSNSTQAQAEAVAELSYEVGVAYESTYGRHGTGAQTSSAVTLLPEHFGYSTAINRKRWIDCDSDEEWFNVFKEQIDLGRPVQLALKGYSVDAPNDLVNHAVGVDGYLFNGEFLVHINMGWQHQADGWYALNNIVTGTTHWVILERQHCIRDIFPATCSSPPVPAGFEVDQTTVDSESTYFISWDTAAGADYYEIVEATDPSFADGISLEVTGNAGSYSHEVSEGTTFYYRIRSLSHCGPGLMPSSWSETLSVQVIPPNPSEVGDFVYLVPGIARSSGAQGTEWTSDLSICNMADWPGELVLTYRHPDGAEVASTVIPEGQMVEWQDVIANLFGLAEPSSGAVEVAADVPLVVTARTFNQGPDGTFGQLLPGCALEDALTAGVTAIVPQIRRSDDFRTNIGMVNMGSSTCRIRIQLYSAAGEALGSALSLSAAAGSWKQLNQVFVRAGVDACPAGFATVEITSPEGNAWVYASVVDNHTGDPMTIPATIP